MENHEIYNELFNNPHNSKTPVEDFLSRNMLLLGQLKPRQPENVEVDILYALLCDNIRNHFPRSAIKTYLDLVRFSVDAEKDTKGRCTLCKRPGHTEDECLKKTSKMHFANASQRSLTHHHHFQGIVGFKSAEELREKVLNKDYVVPISASLPSLKILRPGVTFKAAGRKEVAFLNSSSNVNVASVFLYQHLKKMKFSFREVTAMVDDYTTTENKKVLITNADIFLEGRRFKVEFIFFQDVRYKVSVLGYGFIKDSEIWMHMNSEGKWKWGFGDTSKEEGWWGVEIDQVVNDSSTQIDFLSVNIL